LTWAIFPAVYGGFGATLNIFAHAAINFMLGRRAFGHG